MHWATETRTRSYFVLLLSQMKGLVLFQMMLLDLWCIFLHIIDFSSFFWFDVGPGAPAVFNCVSLSLKPRYNVCIFHYAVILNKKINFHVYVILNKQTIFISLWVSEVRDTASTCGVWTVEQNVLFGAHFSLDCWIKTISCDCQLPKHHIGGSNITDELMYFCCLFRYHMATKVNSVQCLVVIWVNGFDPMVYLGKKLFP